MQLIAVNCQDDEDYCREKIVNYYPDLRLYVQGISVEFERTEQLPEIPTIFSFISSKVKAETLEVQSVDELKDKKKPFVVFYAP